MQLIVLISQKHGSKDLLHLLHFTCYGRIHHLFDGAETRFGNLTDQLQELLAMTHALWAQNFKTNKAEKMTTPKKWGLAWQGCTVKTRRIENREPRIENRESRIENRESRTENREPRIENRESRIENRESRTENRESRTENRKSRIENRESRIENREPRIENRESRIENRESRIENRESRIENRESRIENRKSRIENYREPRIENRESRIENRKSRIENRELSRTENRESRIENRESRIENREPRIENREPRIENREPRIENREQGLSSRVWKKWKKGSLKIWCFQISKVRFSNGEASSAASQREQSAHAPQPRSSSTSDLGIKKWKVLRRALHKLRPCDPNFRHSCCRISCSDLAVLCEKRPAGMMLLVQLK